MVSRFISKAEQNYAQVDLETMTVNYALWCFCIYLIGSSHKNVIAIDQLPLLGMFNGEKKWLNKDWKNNTVTPEHSFLSKGAGYPSRLFAKFDQIWPIFNVWYETSRHEVHLPWLMGFFAKDDGRIGL